MFSQEDDTLERGSAGLGIGLTLVKTLVELHDGTVVAESEGIGKGSTFTVRIPTVANPKPTTVMPEVSVQGVSTRSLKVLIVEDMQALRMITARLLEKLGHVVEFAENGPLALLKLETFVPDVLFSDIAMPGMNGYELAQRIRQRPDYSQIHLVALTGFGQSSDRDKALGAGFDEHMVKPVDIALLRRCLRESPDRPQIVDLFSGPRPSTAVPRFFCRRVSTRRKKRHRPSGVFQILLAYCRWKYRLKRRQGREKASPMPGEAGCRLISKGSEPTTKRDAASQFIFDSTFFSMATSFASAAFASDRSVTSSCSMLRASSSFRCRFARSSSVASFSRVSAAATAALASVSSFCSLVTVSWQASIRFLPSSMALRFVASSFLFASATFLLAATFAWSLFLLPHGLCFRNLLVAFAH